MAITLDATVGGANANSYADTTEADAYFATRADASAWPTDAEEKKKLLVSATRRLDQEDYDGGRASTSQSLAFPRSGLSADGLSIDSETIPARVKRALFETALDLVAHGSDEATGLEAFESVKVGPLEVKLREATTKLSDLPEPARRELAPFLVSANRNQVRLMRG